MPSGCRPRLTPVSCGVGPRAAARHSRRRSCGSRLTRAWSGSAAATRWSASRSSRTCSSAATRSTIAHHARTLETISFHAGRYWPLEAALWDLARTGVRYPASVLFGGAVTALPVYASWGELRPPDGRSEDAQELVRSGFRAVKVRIAREQLEEGIAVVAAVRAAVGDALADPRRPQPVVADGRRHRARPRAGRCATGDRGACASTTCCGSRSHSPARTRRHARLREGTGVRIAGGEMASVRGAAPRARRRRARRLPARRRARTRDLGRADARRTGAAAQPLVHAATWTNGIGLLANLHVCAGVGGGPLLEFPYDPPGWTPSGATSCSPSR